MGFMEISVGIILLSGMDAAANADYKNGVHGYNGDDKKLSDKDKIE